MGGGGTGQVTLLGKDVVKMSRSRTTTPGRVALRFWLVSALFASLILAAYEASAIPGTDRTFGLFYRSVTTWRQGGDPYSVVRYASTALSYPNLNPPIWLLVFTPLTTLPVNLAAIEWGALTLFALVGGVLLAAKDGGSRAWLTWRGLAILAGPVVWETFSQGQVYPLVLVPLAGGWLLTRRGRGALGALHLGLAIALKPPLFLIVVALAWLDRRLAALTAVASAIWFFAPLPVVGVNSYLRWIAITRLAPVRGSFNASLPSLADRSIGTVAGGLVALAIVGTVILVSRRLSTREAALAVGVCGALAASPITWPTYFTLLLPVFFWLARTRPFSRVFDVALLAASVPMILEMMVNMVPWYSIALVGFCAEVVRVSLAEASADHRTSVVKPAALAPGDLDPREI